MLSRSLFNHSKPRRGYRSTASEVAAKIAVIGMVMAALWLLSVIQGGGL